MMKYKYKVLYPFALVRKKSWRILISPTLPRLQSNNMKMYSEHKVGKYYYDYDPVSKNTHKLLENGFIVLVDQGLERFVNGKYNRLTPVWSLSTTKFSELNYE